MKLESVYKTTDKGIRVEFRSADADEAELMIDYLRKVAGETRFLLSEPEEIRYTVEGEREFLQKYAASENSLMVCAYVDGIYAGNGSFSPFGEAERYSHRATLGIALLQDYRNLGIGKALMRILIDKACECGFEILELDVVAANEGALHLYRKLGFTECGRVRNAMKYKDGTYADEFHMQLFL